MRYAAAFVATVLGTALADGCSGGGGAGAPGTYHTSVPGDKPLNGLSSTELQILCNDLGAYLEHQEGDTCRLNGFLAAAFLAGASSTATDADLEATCSETTASCMSRFTGTCGPRPSATCAATVAEQAACINDATVQNHMAAAGLPDCSGTTRAAVTAHSSAVSMALTGTQPASCQTYSAKCPGGAGTILSPVDGGATD